MICFKDIINYNFFFLSEIVGNQFVALQSKMALMTLKCTTILLMISQYILLLYSKTKTKNIVFPFRRRTELFHSNFGQPNFRLPREWKASLEV